MPIWGYDYCEMCRLSLLYFVVSSCDIIVHTAKSRMALFTVELHSRGLLYRSLLSSFAPLQTCLYVFPALSLNARPVAFLLMSVADSLEAGGVHHGRASVAPPGSRHIPPWGCRGARARRGEAIPGALQATRNPDHGISTSQVA